MALNLSNGQRAQRKLLITVLEWTGASHDIYNHVTGATAPTWAASTYYQKNADGTYTVLSSEPSDWSTNYTSYYTKTTSTNYREILGTRTEDSSIEFNADVQTSTDIRGVTYTDVNKTEPQQTLDPYYILGGSDLSEYMTKAALKNNIDAYNGVFTAYIITAFIGQSAAYYTVKHTGCSVIPQSMGGDSYTNLPLELHFSNNITEGTVDKLGDDFVFTATVNI